MLRSSIQVVWLLPAACLCAAESKAPPLPQPDLSGLDERYVKQIESARARAAAEPADAEAVGSYGMLLHAFGRAEPAAKSYARARALDPGSFRWSYYHGAALQELRRRRDAIDALYDARGSSGDYAPYFVRLGELLREEGRLEESEEAFRRALELQPELPSAHLGLGRTLSDSGRFDEAVKSYEQATAIAKNYAAAHYALGLAYRRTGQADEARRALERYQRLKPLEQPRFDPLMDAVAALRGGGATPDPSEDFTPDQRRAFAEELELAIGGNPELVSAHSNLIALYWQLGETTKAGAHYRKALEIDPDYADAHYNWGGVELARGNASAALASFERALQSDPGHVNALVRSGLLLERAGKGDEAEARYRAALEGNPAQRQANYLLARRLASRGEYREAAARLEETVRIEDEATPSYLRALASTYLRAGDSAAARERLREAERQALALGRQDLAETVRADLERLPK